MRIEAYVSLRHWLGRRSTHSKLLGEMLLEKRYTPTQADTILHLLHGFNADDLAKPETYAALIYYLDHNKLAIRQLAHVHLFGLVRDGKKIRYDPAGDSEQRQRAIEEWKKLIPDGKVPPKPQASEAPRG